MNPDCGAADADAVGLSLPVPGSFDNHDSGSYLGAGQNCDHCDLRGHGPCGHHVVEGRFGSHHQHDCDVRVDCRSFAPSVDHTLPLQDHQVLATFPGTLFQLTSEGHRTWRHQQTQPIFRLLRHRRYRCMPTPPGT